MGFSTMKKINTEEEKSALDDFIEKVFHSIKEDEIIFFTAHSSTPTGKTPWPFKNYQSIKDGNALHTYHYGISTVYKMPDGTISRKRDRFAALHVIVLDDVGTKAQENALPPSYRIETSEGNYQWGYVLDKPIRDRTLADKLISAVYSKKSITDTGGAMANKLVKLPIGINLKDGRDNFKVKMHELNELRYSIEDLIDAWNLDLDPKQVVPKFSPNAKIVDDVFEFLKKENLIKGEQGDGWYTVDCPRADEHSGGIPDAGYSPLGEGPDPLKRQAKCFHQHDGVPLDTHEFLTYVRFLDGPDCGINAPPEAYITEDNPHHPLDQPIPAEHFPDLKELKNGNFRIKKTHRNIEYILQAYGYEYYYNVISKKSEISHPKMLDDKSADNYRSSMQFSVASQCALSQFDIGMEMQVGYLEQLTLSKPRNPVIEYMDSLPTYDYDKDYVRQVADLFTLTNDKDREIFNIFLRKWLIQCVAAADGAEQTPNPDALPKYESVLVLAGAQGVQKTKFWNAIVPMDLKDYFADGAIIDPSNKDSQMLLMQCWIVEWGEIDATFRRADLSQLKAFLSQGKDLIRMPYGRTINEYKRRTSFCASVNGTDFLNDTTGNRRFWPIGVDHIELPGEELVDKMWSQVYTMYLAGDTWWIDDEKMVLEAADHVHKYHSCHDDPDIAMLLETFGRICADTMLTDETQWMTVKQICDASGIEFKKRSTSSKVRDYIRSCLPVFKQKLAEKRGSGNQLMFKMPMIEKKY